MNAKKTRLDHYLVLAKLVETRSQAETLIKLGEVTADGRVITKPGYFVSRDMDIKITAGERYVSRAGLKLASVAMEFGLDFHNKVVLDVGSSTGGFTDYALQHGARKVIAIDVGTNQLHPKLRGDKRVSLHEQTDIRGVVTADAQEGAILIELPDIVLVDVSFISLRSVLPHIASIIGRHTVVAAMLKPQFEAGDSVKHKGVIKNERIRRDILNKFEAWAKRYFVIKNKADSKIAGSKGNRERFYILKRV